jgi:LPXTG-site transpeptidase (sortase) family protein
MIDSIGLDLPLLSGLTEEMTSPSWCTTSSGFGQSGFSIVGGHRTSHGAAFRHLPEVSIGDTIVIVSNGSRFEYRVTEAPVSYTEADAAKVLQGTASRNILKLFTCGPNPGESTARWIVTAKLVKVG